MGARTTLNGAPQSSSGGGNNGDVDVQLGHFNVSVGTATVSHDIIEHVLNNDSFSPRPNAALPIAPSPALAQQDLVRGLLVAQTPRWCGTVAYLFGMFFP